MEIDHKAKSGKHVKFAVVSIFLLILLFIVMTSFSESFPITGNILTGSIINQGLDEESIEEGIVFESELTVPEMSLDKNFGNVEISGSSNSFINIGRQSFDLRELSNNFIVLHDFSGDISFDNEMISSLDGRVSGVTINGVSNTGSNRVSFEEFDYESLHIEEKLSVNEIAYTASGYVSLNGGKETFNINEDSVKISGFYGSVTIEDNKFKANGHIKRLVISGDTNIDIRK